MNPNCSGWVETWKAAKFLYFRSMKLSLLFVLLLNMLSAAAQKPSPDVGAIYGYPKTHPDSALTRQAFRLGQHFDEAGWETLAAVLQPKPQPVGTYLGFYPNHYLQSSLLLLSTLLPPSPSAKQVAFICSLEPTVGGLRHRLYGNGFGEQFIGASVSRKAVDQLYSHLGKLSSQRLQSDYDRLSDILLRRATKVRSIKEALPVMKFMVDSTGWVQDVAVDTKRTKMGLTQRSRKIILTALRDERFRALEARRVFTKPRPVAAKVHHIAKQLTCPVKQFFHLFRLKKLPLDRCGPHSQKQARQERRYLYHLVQPRQ